MRRFLPLAALVGVALVLGCQDVGTGPDGLVPQFHGDHLPCEAHNKNDEGCGGGNGDPVVDPGTLFESAGPIEVAGMFPAVGGTCAGGATNTGGTSRGTVNFNQPRDDSHTHANVQLRGAPEGEYLILGNHDVVCSLTGVVDFPLRRLHDNFVTVGANGKGKARIGLTYVTEDPGGFSFNVAERLAMHVGGDHRLWVTLVAISGPALENGGTVELNRYAVGGAAFQAVSDSIER